MTERSALSGSSLPIFAERLEVTITEEATRVARERLEAGMDPQEVRESMRRWAERLAARTRHAVDAGCRDATKEARR